MDGGRSFSEVSSSQLCVEVVFDSLAFSAQSDRKRDANTHMSHECPTTVGAINSFNPV